jgi:uncharacterized protein
VLILFAPQLRRLLGASGVGAGVIDVVLVEGVLIVGALLAARLGGTAGIADAWGVRRWPWTDILAGVAAGLLLRAIVESLWPTVGGLGGPFGAPAVADVLVIVIGSALIAPIVEEVFFRGALQRALHSALWGAGRAIGGAAAIVASTAAFVAMHTIGAGETVPVALVVATALTGLVCGTLTAVTGRLGAALAAHLVFNIAGILLLAL